MGSMTVIENPFSSPSKKHLLLDKIDRIGKFKDVRVVYFNGKSLTELRPHPPVCMESYLTVVIRGVPAADAKKIDRPTPNARNEDDRFYSELLGASLSCGAAVLSWVVVAGSSAAIPVTGGTSTAITVLSYGAATASSLQCANSSYRLYNESNYGDPEVNAWLDSQGWYEHTSTALDVISVAGGLASAGATLKMALQLQKSGTPMKEVLKGLSRHQRKRLTQEIIRTNNPGISNKVLKSLVAAGKYPKRFGKFDLSNTVRLQLKDAIGATLSFGGSATSGIIRSPSAIPNVAIAVFEEFVTY